MTATIVPTPKKPTVALLIDGENIRAARAGQILTRASKTAHPTVKRVYGNAIQITDWGAAPGFRVVHSGSIKNGADILLSIDAVHLSHTEQIDTFAIATSDQDFSHLAHHLRERGFHVIGIGEEKAPLAFRKACSTFHEVTGKPEVVPKPAPAPEKKRTALDNQIFGLIGAATKKQIGISQLSNLMNTKFNVQAKALPQKNWRKYLESKSHLYLCDPKSRTAKVRLAPELQKLA